MLPMKKTESGFQGDQRGWSKKCSLAFNQGHSPVGRLPELRGTAKVARTALLCDGDPDNQGSFESHLSAPLGQKSFRIMTKGTNMNIDKRQFN